MCVSQDQGGRCAAAWRVRVEIDAGSILEDRCPNSAAIKVFSRIKSSAMQLHSRHGRMPPTAFSQHHLIGSGSHLMILLATLRYQIHSLGRILSCLHFCW